MNQVIQNIDPAELQEALTRWGGQLVYVHLEVNPGAYWRNGKAVLDAAFVRGSGTFRVFLQLDGEQGLIQVDQLTHMQLTDDQVICIGYDQQSRLSRTLEVSLTPFKM
ncbi:MAG: DUF1806 family protein [Acidibacillus sp.]|uniref:Uncharacterized protein n=1 Tax=Sulfoacidibacillus ferrooxidans TaxID=2005001 RepID=A0A9X2AF05_9BACL|nr:hypothetical protein [Sulfoacidibacillus ferrooxidans]MCY0893583.1 DUF1806 family protein [Acidibacillus sp.]